MKRNYLKRIVSIGLAAAFAFATLAGCGQSSDSSESSSSSASSAAEESTASADENIVLKGITDLTPHSELIEFVKPQLEEQGITIELVSTASDSTTNEKLSAGEIDFNFFQHLPYLEDECATNGYDLASAGSIHVEPITAYSDKYEKTEEIPDDATVAIPNNGTNEYRALRILEENGFITLNEDVKDSLSASVADIAEYLKPIEIIELDADSIIPTKDDFDFFIVNTNKALEANLTSNKLFSEGSDSPYANIIAVRSEDVDNPAIQALVEALQSDETKQFIEDNYDGAVIPAEE